MRLIDADALRKKVCGWFHRDPQEADDQDECAAALCMAIDEATSVDAEPVRHGHWIKAELLHGEQYYICSACADIFRAPECMGNPIYSHCPGCGAKMDADAPERAEGGGA